MKSIVLFLFLFSSQVFGDFPKTVPDLFDLPVSVDDCFDAVEFPVGREQWEIKRGWWKPMSINNRYRIAVLIGQGHAEKYRDIRKICVDADGNKYLRGDWYWRCKKDHVCKY